MSCYSKLLWKDKKEYDEWIIDLNEWYEEETAKECDKAREWFKNNNPNVYNEILEQDKLKQRSCFKRLFSWFLS